jgi:murein DD-endopeptidase MepM/ murein hydrolase activator NlpD
MPKIYYKLLVLIPVILVLSGCQAPSLTVNQNNNQNTSPEVVANANINKNNVNQGQITEPSNKNNLVEPIAEFKQRITKKFFGTYVTPQDSPVQPERFKGYHTGVDVEYADATGTVDVLAIADGVIKYSGWVSGYGGVEIISLKINAKNYMVLYGHLKPSSLLKAGTEVVKSQKIAVLGKGYSTETDGERRHLHFSIYPGMALNFKGYVQTQAELSNWVDPLSFY